MVWIDVDDESFDLDSMRGDAGLWLYRMTKRMPNATIGGRSISLDMQGVLKDSTSKPVEQICGACPRDFYSRFQTKSNDFDIFGSDFPFSLAGHKTPRTLATIVAGIFFLESCRLRQVLRSLKAKT